VGDTQFGSGNPQPARTAWQQAMAIIVELDHRDANVELDPSRRQPGLAPSSASSTRTSRVVHADVSGQAGPHHAGAASVPAATFVSTRTPPGWPSRTGRPTPPRRWSAV